MNKCKDCGLWKPETNDFHWMGKCIDLTESDLVIVSEVHPKIPILTHRYFGCVHFEEKKSGPFCVVRSDSEIHIIDSWYLTFGKNVSPTLFKNADVAEMWCDWLNELWAQREIEIQKEIRFCSTCKHDDEDLLFCGRHAFVCGRWSPKEKGSPDKNHRCECKTCSFWKDKHPFSDGMWGSCEYAEMRKALPAHCGKAIAGGAFSDIKNCTFHTREDFGCNQWTNL